MQERTLTGYPQFHPRLDGLAFLDCLAASTYFICLGLGKLLLSATTFGPVPLEEFSIRVAVGKEGCLSQ